MSRTLREVGEVRESYRPYEDDPRPYLSDRRRSATGGGLGKRFLGIFEKDERLTLSVSRTTAQLSGTTRTYCDRQVLSHPNTTPSRSPPEMLLTAERCSCISMSHYSHLAIVCFETHYATYALYALTRSTHNSMLQTSLLVADPERLNSSYLNKLSYITHERKKPEQNSVCGPRVTDSMALDTKNP